MDYVLEAHGVDKMSGVLGVSGQYYYSRDPSSIYKNPVESAFGEKTEREIRGIDAGTENMEMAQSVTRISDGALDGIQDYLQKIRELAVKALNSFVYNADDRQVMQDQVEQYKQGIADIAASTSFNENKLLDGSHQKFDVAADGNGRMESVSAGNATLKALGIDEIDFTKKVDTKVIDKAMEKVSSLRSTNGAESNNLDHAIAFNRLSSENHLATYKEDDLQTMVNRSGWMKKNQLLQAVQTQMQKKQADAKRIHTLNLLG